MILPGTHPSRIDTAIQVVKNWDLRHGHNFLLGIIAVNPLEVRPVCALPTRGSKLITLLT